ncbi:MAG: hypothetical protein R3305_03655, partial [Gammaproteobacteria bacterium]|nr:hypothetical protein [Gammaproteobacteria bacterium]
MKNTARPVWSKKLSLAGSTLVLGAGIGAGSAAMAAESFSPHAYALEEVPSFSAYGGFRSFDAL